MLDSAERTLPCPLCGTRSVFTCEELAIAQSLAAEEQIWEEVARQHGDTGIVATKAKGQ